MIGIFLAAVCVVAMPVAFQAPIPVRTMAAIALGILAIEATWATRCFPVFPPLPMQGPAERAEIRALGPSIYAAYLVGGVAAGLVVGLLRPLTRWPLGTMLLGVLGGVCVYGAMAPVVELTRGPWSSLTEVIGIALACGLLAGPPGALALRYHAGAAGEFDEYAV